MQVSLCNAPPVDDVANDVANGVVGRMDDVIDDVARIAAGFPL